MVATLEDNPEYRLTRIIRIVALALALTGGRRWIGDAAQPAFRFAEVEAEVAAAAAAVAVGLAVNLDEDFLVWSEKTGSQLDVIKLFCGN